MNKNVMKMTAVSFLQSLVFYGPVATLYRLKRGISMPDIFIMQIIYSLASTGLEIPWGWVAPQWYLHVPCTRCAEEKAAMSQLK